MKQMEVFFSRTASTSSRVTGKLSFSGSYFAATTALVLALVSQPPSLLPPRSLIFRHVIDEYATRSTVHHPQFFRASAFTPRFGGVAFVSRVRELPDYSPRSSAPRARLSDGPIRSAFRTPCSGPSQRETLGRSDVRSDLEAHHGS